MTKAKTTKRALLLSALSMLLCVSMLVGSTFAWFTDSVTSGKNQIVAGNLDVELEYVTAEAAKDGITEAEWETVNPEDSLFAKDALWEPGYTEVVYLRVKNAGSLALKYKLGINVAEKVIGKTADDKDIDLAQYIEFGVVEAEEVFENRAAARDAVKDSAVKLAAGYAGTEATLEKEESSKTLALVVYMPETVGNEANYGKDKTQPKISLGINLVATQAAVESDSFGKDYDDEAKYPDVETIDKEWFEESTGEPTSYTISSPAELAGLAELVAGGESFDGKTIELAGDITLDGASNWVAIGTELNPFKGTFKGNNHTIYGLNITGEHAAIAGLFGFVDGATIENLTVSGEIKLHGTISDRATSSSGWMASGICAFAMNNTTISGCTNLVNIDVSEVKVTDVVGIIGRVVASGVKTTVTNCTNKGNITAPTVTNEPYIFAGGVVGMKSGDMTVSGCTGTGTVSGGYELIPGADRSIIGMGVSFG